MWLWGSCSCQVSLPLGPFTSQVLVLFLGSHTLTVLSARAGSPETHPGLHCAERRQLRGVTEADTPGATSEDSWSLG